MRLFLHCLGKFTKFLRKVVFEVKTDASHSRIGQVTDLLQQEQAQLTSVQSRTTQRSIDNVLNESEKKKKYKRKTRKQKHLHIFSVNFSEILNENVA